MHKILHFIDFKKVKGKSIWDFDNVNEVRESRILEKVSKDLDSGNFIKAISRLEGYLQYAPTNQNIHYRLGKLYCEIGDFIRAGKHFYFTSDKTLNEIKCVEAFKKSFGNDPLLILKKLPYRSKRSVIGIDQHTKNQLMELLLDAKNKHEHLPSFVTGLIRNLT